MKDNEDGCLRGVGVWLWVFGGKEGWREPQLTMQHKYKT